MDSAMYYAEYAKERLAAAITEATVVATNSTTAPANVTASPRVDDGGVSMNNFYPALVQCFGIIICGLVLKLVNPRFHARLGYLSILHICMLSGFFHP